MKKSRGIDYSLASVKFQLFYWTWLFIEFILRLLSFFLPFCCWLIIKTCIASFTFFFLSTVCRVTIRLQELSIFHASIFDSVKNWLLFDAFKVVAFTTVTPALSSSTRTRSRVRSTWSWCAASTTFLPAIRVERSSLSSKPLFKRSGNTPSWTGEQKQKSVLM